REASVYRALSETSVPVPKLLAVSADGDAMLVERVTGTDEFLSLSEDQRAAVVDDFLAVVARLHSLDLATLDLAFPRPTTPGEHATLDIDLWHRLIRDHADPNPMLEFTFGWLRRHTPVSVARTVLCHGDCGPGNFLHDSEVVTSLLDWEFAH